MTLTLLLSLSKWQLFQRLGAAGLVLLGILDSSLVPVPGSLDLFTIILAALHHDLWLYYAAMSTTGSVIGGYLTYRIGRKGIAEAEEHRVLSQDKIKPLEKKFERYGFATVLIGVLLPPPFPMTTVLVAAGAFEYPVKRFLAAFALGRFLRFSTDAYLGSIYGRRGYQYLTAHQSAITTAFIILACLIAGGLTFYFLKYRHKKRQASP